MKHKWKTLKAIFSMFNFFFCTIRFRFSNSCVSAKYCPILTNHTSVESIFIQLSCDVYIKNKTGFVVQGHIFEMIIFGLEKEWSNCLISLIRA